MLSRVADAIYWLNRYVERAENIARFVDVNLNLLLDSPSGLTQPWDPIVMTTGDQALFQDRYGSATADSVIQFLTFDKEYGNSIIACLLAARENARSIREIISSEMWERVNAFFMFVKAASETEKLSDPHHFFSFFSEVKQHSHLFAGVMDSTMTHNEGWHFGQLGRFLERADKTARILDVKCLTLLPPNPELSTTMDELQWIALLRSTSAYEMYRKRRAHRITPIGVTEFLILDRDFPRSIQFCLQQADHSLRQITGTPIGTWQDPVERSLGRLRADLDYLTIEDIMQQQVHTFLDNLQIEINGIGQKLYEAYFASLPMPA